jgi:hypothetical protein
MKGMQNNSSICLFLDTEQTICVARKVVAKLYDSKAKYKSCHTNLNKLRVRLATSKDCFLVRIPPSESAFKHNALRASIQTKTWFVRSKHILGYISFYLCMNKSNLEGSLMT